MKRFYLAQLFIRNVEYEYYSTFKFITEKGEAPDAELQTIGYAIEDYAPVRREQEENNQKQA